MLSNILLYVGSIVITLWGIAHIIPTRSVVNGFGAISADNKRIITMEWAAEGLALCFIGVLVLFVTALGGVQVLVNGRPVPLWYVSPTQINFQLPWELSTSNEIFADSPGSSYLPIYTVRVQDGDLSSNLAYLTGQKDSPQLMFYGSNLAVAQDSSYATIGPSHPAKPGEMIVVYLLGVSSLTATTATGDAAPLDTLVQFSGQVSASVGNQAATVFFAGLTPQSVGLEQMNLRVPFLQPGVYDLKVSVNGWVSNAVRLHVGAP